MRLTELQQNINYLKRSKKMAVTKLEVTELYVATFNRAPDATGLNFWVNSGATIEEIAEIFFMLPETQNKYPEGTTDEEFVTTIYQNVFGRDPEADGLAFWVGEGGLGGGVPRSEMILTVIGGAQGTDADVLANKTEVGLYYADELGIDTPAGEPFLLDGVTDDEATVVAAKAAADELVVPVEPPVVPGDSFMLTSSSDFITGTAGNDFFDAPIVQIPYTGGVSNSLSTADRLDGGAGWDTLHAELVPEFWGWDGYDEVQVQPRTQNIQEVKLEVVSHDLGDVVVDAKKMLDVVKIGSYYSDGDLVIHNLTTKTSDGGVRNTEDITITMDHTDNFNSDGDASDLKVLFDDNYLLSGEDSEFTLELRIVNAFRLAEEDMPLVGFLSVTFTAGTEEVTVDISTADTYAEVVTLINDELDSLGIDVTAVALPLRSAVFTDDIGPYSQGDFAGNYTPVQLVSNSLELLAGPIDLDSNVQDFDGLNTWTSPTSSTSDNPVSVNVELHKVGRGGEGGDLIIGAKSAGSGSGSSNNGSGDSDGAGIPVIYVDVLGDDKKPSNLGQIDTTGKALEEIYISTHDDYVDGDSFASLTIRNDFDSTPTLVDADDFLGDLTMGSSLDLFANIRTMTATGGGDVEYWAEVGTSPLASLGNLAFTATTAGGDDTIYVEVGGGAQMIVTTGAGDDTVIASVNGSTNSDSTQSAITINSASGNNTVELSSTGTRDADVTTGGGTDTVTGGGTDLTASTGAGNDVIYAENTGVWADASIQADEWVEGVGSLFTNGIVTINGSDVSADQLLYGREVQVTLGAPGNVANPFVVGFEATESITAAGGGFITSERDLYEAIARAINTDPVLSKLAEASVDSNGQLSGQYLIDGAALALGGIQVEILGDTISAANLTNITNALKVLNSNSAIDATNVENAYVDLFGHTQIETGFVLNGSNSTTNGSNVINAGLGDDVIVLSSADAVGDRFDTVEFDVGVFGNDTIVHFQVADEGIDGDVLDFTAWLDDVESATTSTISQVRIDTDVATVNATTAFQANSVRIVDFTTIAVTADIDEWSDLAGASASKLLAWVDGTFNSLDESGTDLVGSTQNSILIVQNEDNYGEYAVFQVVSDADTTDINSVQLIGTMDFGEELNFAADNFA
jgi:hypothetical protein